MQLILHLVRLYFRGAALTLVLMALALGLAGLGGAFSDRLDVANHFAPVWLAMALAGALVGAIVSRRGERWAVVVMGVLAMLLHGGLMAPELVAARGVLRTAFSVTELPADLNDLLRKAK